MWARSKAPSQPFTGTRKLTPTLKLTMPGTTIPLSSYSYSTAISWGYLHLGVFAKTQNQTSSTARLYRKCRSIGFFHTTWYPDTGSLTLISQVEAWPMNQVPVGSQAVLTLDTR